MILGGNCRDEGRRYCGCCLSRLCGRNRCSGLSGNQILLFCHPGIRLFREIEALCFAIVEQRIIQIQHFFFTVADLLASQIVACIVVAADESIPTRCFFRLILLVVWIQLGEVFCRILFRVQRGCVKPIRKFPVVGADDVQETACILQSPASDMDEPKTFKASNLFRSSHTAGSASNEPFENRISKPLKFDGVAFHTEVRNTIDDVIGRLLPFTLKHRLIVVEFRRFDAEDILQRVNQSSRLLTLCLEFALNRILLFEFTQCFPLFLVQLSLCFLDCLNQPQFRTPEILLAIRTGECRIRQHIGGLLCHFLVFTENISRMAKTMFLCQPQEIQHEKILFPFT